MVYGVQYPFEKRNKTNQREKKWKSGSGKVHIVLKKGHKLNTYMYLLGTRNLFE